VPNILANDELLRLYRCCAVFLRRMARAGGNSRGLIRRGCRRSGVSAVIL
jgi:hypothetical protein